MSNLRKINIDGTEYEVPGEYTLMQACEEAAGAEIPRFCYHERLSVAGNCRMCLVEWVGAPKPQASCALTVNDLRPNRDGTPANIRTNSEIVKKAREGVMEFLLINHPLDCPICDQGGECDLQDQAMAYGRDSARFDENKRAVDDKNMGPLVNTIMNRCIQCTRCVRFITEVAGVEEIGLASRGEDAEITTYLEKSLSSELSGNVIDLCPVGALTSKPYAFNARPWELDSVESIDLMDAVGSNIRIDSRAGAVLRIMPINNDAINEEWITDKARFNWDGLSRQRLDKPYVRVGGKLRVAEWDEALNLAAEKLSGDPSKIAAIAGDLCDAESMKALMDLMNSLGVKNIDCRQDGMTIGTNHRETYLFNSTINGIEESDAILIIGANPRLEASLVNTRIRKSWLAGKTSIALIGENSDLTYDFEHLGTKPSDILKIVKGRSGFSKKFKEAKKPSIIVGTGVLNRKDTFKILSYINSLKLKSNLITDEWNGYNILHSVASRVAGLDMGFLPVDGGLDTRKIIENSKKGKIETIFLLGADELDMSNLKSSFIIYQGSHGDAGAHAADVILPGASYAEKTGIYVNLEGRVQIGIPAINPKGQAKEDWSIIRALSGHLGKALPYDNLDALRSKLFEDHSSFAGIGYIEKATNSNNFDILPQSEKNTYEDAPFVNPICDFYMTNVILRASNIMADCSSLIDNVDITEAVK